jgi:LPS-assembly lipoprotein
MSMRKLCVTCLTLLLSACGWQLQGARPLPPALLPVYLQLSDTQSLLARQLRQNLQQAGIATTGNRIDAGSILQISNDQSGHTVTSVSALNEPQQYEIYYRAEYRFDAADSASLIPVQALSASRTMSYDSTRALAKQREQQAVEAMLAQELAQRLLRRLSMVPR